MESWVIFSIALKHMAEKAKIVWRKAAIVKFTVWCKAAVRHFIALSAKIRL
jgi:hypothetical protein